MSSWYMSSEWGPLEPIGVPTPSESNFKVDCLCLIAMFNYDISMLIILIDSLVMIILLTLICIFILLYILFVSTH